MPPEKRSRSQAVSREEAEIRIGWRMAGLGMEVASSVAGGALLGFLWDQWKGTGQKGLLIGSVIGIVVGLWSFIRGALKLNRQLDRISPTLGRARPLPPKAEDDWDKDDWNDRNASTEPSTNADQRDDH